MTLNDRRKYLAEKNISLCEEGCEYEGENIELFQVICYCKIKDSKEDDNSVNQLINGTIGIKNRHNFKVLKCFSLTFSNLGIKNNYFFYIFIILIIFNIFLIIINEIYLKYFLNDLITYCKEYIDNNNTKEEFKKLREIYLVKREDEEIIKKLKRFLKERILNSPPKRSIKNKKNSEENNEISNKKSNEKKLSPIKKRELTNNIDEKIKRIRKKYITLFNEKKIDKKKENDKYFNYYIFLIYAYLKKDRKNYLIEDELNDLDYEYYRNIEDRKWYKIYWSLFISKYDFINTFFILNEYEDFRFYCIKIMIYINSLIISIIVTIAFFWDDTMHKIYEDNGDYTILYQLPTIFISNISMKIISIIFGNIIDYQDDFIELKNNLNYITNTNKSKKIEEKNNENLNKVKIENIRNDIIITDDRLIENKKIDILKSIRNKNNEKEDFGDKIRISFLRNRIIFYIIIIILNIFSWYYASCFCAVYKKTQKHIFFDFLYGIPINLISCLLACIINFLSLK